MEVSEESASSDARHQRNARRRYINTVVEAGLTALGKTAPDRSDEEFFDVLCDFFSRAVVWPEHYGFPTGERRPTVCSSPTTWPASWLSSLQLISPITA
ncbi:hypothetical protein ACWDG1_22760 [Streptomyces sp. NPDC001177]